MSRLEEQVFLGFVLLLGMLVVIGVVLIMQRTLTPWFDSVPPVETSSSPCEETFSSRACTPAEFNAYCTRYNFDGTPRELSNRDSIRCAEFCEGMPNDDSQCPYMNTCGLYVQDMRVYGCMSCDYPEDPLATCSVDDITMLCQSGIALDDCMEYCETNHYSCAFLRLPDASEQVLNYICPQGYDCGL